MKKKNLLTIAVSVALVAALAVGATLAYFTSQDSISNTFTMGNVAIDLKETNDATAADSAYVDSGLLYDQVMPGSTVTKIAKVFVDSTSEDCYLRVTAQVKAATGATLSADDIAELTTAVQNAISTTTWDVSVENGVISCIYKLNDGVALRNDALTVFEEITLPITLGNNAAGQQFTVDLTGYAVQADNVSLTGENAFDWSSVNFETGEIIPVADSTVE